MAAVSARGYGWGEGDFAAPKMNTSAGLGAIRGFAATIALLLAGSLGLVHGALAQSAEAKPDRREAKKAFGAVLTAVAHAPEAIGHYDRGCLAGGQRLPSDGAAWQVMRPSRRRMWGHPALIAFIRKFAADAKALDGWPGLLVGDMAQPIGGPLLGGHASHQIGLDVDLWYLPMPDRTLTVEEREQLSAVSMVDGARLTVDTAVWSEMQVKLLKRAASYPEVARIFVHPAIKKALCDAAGADRAWLARIRPWWQHNDHFHVRLSCPPGSPACAPQPPVDGDDGCGAELEEWFKKLRAPPPPKPAKPVPPPKPLLVADLPKACQALLAEAEKKGHSHAAAP